jgi:hypothetical protein
MTPELEKRWKDKRAPFDGVTLYTEEEFGVGELRQKFRRYLKNGDQV